jgi:LmbE family N-acetylglucosaminyl deacetylase
MKILILSPHTDDAELGCGGSIIRFIQQKNEIFWLTFSTAEDSLPHNLPKDTLKREFTSILDNLELNETNYEICNFKVRYLHEHRQEILDKLIHVRDLFKPDLVIGPSLNDFHQDHQVVANEMVRAFKTTSSIISYELPWNHISFNTQMFIKLNSDQVSKKYELLQKYKSQLVKNRTYFSKEFTYGLCKTRGIQCDSNYAEAFEVIRWMI